MLIRNDVVKSSIFLFFLLVAIFKGTPLTFGESASVPNQGSPYVNFDTVKDNQIVHLPTGLQVSLRDMIEMVSRSRVIYVGETHDNLEAHRAQLEVIRKLEEKFPGRVAVGMEMFRRSAQESLDLWHQDGLVRREFKKLFYKHWGGDFKLYAPIFEYIKNNGIPLFGLKSTQATQKLLKERGPDKDPGAFPEMDTTDPYHRSYSMSIFGGHASHGSKYNPYQMLLLWEETMAETVANFLKEPDRADWKLVVLAGGFHVQYGFGIPKRAFRRVPHAYSIILPIVTEIPEQLKDRQMNVESVAIPLYSADFGWKLPYKVLPENKIKLGVFLEERDRGIRVRSVVKNSDAARAGLMQDDILLSLDDQSLLSVEDMIAYLQTKNFGDSITARLIRKEVEISMEIRLSED